MLASPRRPSSTTRIFSSAEKCRRVARRMSWTIRSAGALTGSGFCLIFAPDGYDDPEILRSRIPSICPTGADGGHRQRLLCRAAGLQERREVRALAELRDREVDPADPRLPAALAVAIAVVHALDAAHAGGHPRQLVDLDRHHPLG